jgi:hypothetical protein
MTPGRPPGIVAHTGLDAEAKRAFADWLKARGERPLRHRATRENVAAYLDGYGRCAGPAQSVADIQEAAGLTQGRRKGPLFGLIGEGSWQGDAARVLACNAALRGPDALAIDLSEYRSAGCAYEVLSLHAVFAGRSLPIDWRRVRIESEDAEDDVEGRCRKLVLELVDGFGAALPSTHPSRLATKLPVVGTQQSLAENSPLRPALASRRIEYALGITTEYHARLAIEPRDSPVSEETLPEAAFCEPHGAVSHRDGMAIGLRDVQRSSQGPFLDEHLVQIGEPGERYFVARGRLEPAPRIASYPLALRSIEVAEIAASLPIGSLADPFGVASFNHPRDGSWRRHMLLLSLYELFLLEEGE